MYQWPVKNDACLLLQSRSTVKKKKKTRRNKVPQNCWYKYLSTSAQCTKHHITEAIKYKGVLFYITHTKNILQPTKALYNLQTVTSIKLVLVSALGCHSVPSSESFRSKEYKSSLGITLPVLAY